MIGEVNARAVSAHPDGNAGKNIMCPICDAAMEIYLDQMFDDRYGYPNTFRLDKCPVCNLIQTVPLLVDDDLPGLYGNYYPRRNIDIAGLEQQVGEPQLLRARLQRWLTGTDNQGQYSAKSGDIVLDYGCGTGVSLLEVRKLGGRPYGVEADPNVAPIAEYYDIPIHVGQLSENLFQNVKFDLIVLNQVIEHVPNPGRLLELLKLRLTESGKMVLSFPNTASIYRRLFSRKWINWHIPYHLYHYDRKSFQRFAFAHGFRIESYRTVTPNLWTVLQFRALFTKPIVGVPSRIWASDGGSGEGTQSHDNLGTGSGNTKKSIYRLLRYGVKTVVQIASVLIIVTNRIIDLAGLGDSIVVIVRPNTKG